MNINQINLGYKILMLLSVMDEKYSLSEGHVMLRYIESNLKDKAGAFDYQKHVDDLKNIHKEKYKEYCIHYAVEFNKLSNETDKLNFLYFCYELAGKDSNITLEEESAIKAIAKIFNIDLTLLFSPLSDFGLDIEN